MDYLDINTCFGSLPDRPFDVDAAKLVEILKHEGISQAVTASLAGAFLGPEEGNIETLEACEDYPELLPAATVDPRSYFGRGDMVLKAREHGFVMLRLFNRLQQWPLDFSPVEVIFEEAHEAGLPVMVDATYYGDITRACQLGAVTSTPVIVVGIGYDKLSEAIVCMTEYADLYVDTSLIVTPDGLKVMCEEVGSERILFGSGAAERYAGSARLTLASSGLPEEEVRGIASQNALKLLGKS